MKFFKITRGEKVTKFSVFFKNFLTESGLKLEYVAKKTKFSVSSIGHYTSGFRNPSYKFLNVFFKEFKINEEEQKSFLKLVELDKMPPEMHNLKFSKKPNSSVNSFFKNLLLNGFSCDPALCNLISKLTPEQKKEVENFIKKILLHQKVK